MTNEIQIDDRSPSADQKALPQRKRGKFTIFLGMAPGVGKTCAMLQAAQKEKLLGRDVVIGCVETHGAKAALALSKGLPQIPFKTISKAGSSRGELNIEAILARQPHVVLLDELAQRNDPGARHPRRYQDVVELLEAGIDVFTTLDVHAVASRAHIVRQITGVEMGETVPDSLLDDAELELVDLSPAKFLKRLSDGMLHVKQNSSLMEANYFSEENLTALRELVVRLAADRMARAAQFSRRAAQTARPTEPGASLPPNATPKRGIAGLSLHFQELLRESTWPQYCIAVGLVSIITLFVFHFGPLIGGPHAAALIFLLAVVVLGSFVGRGPTLVAATMSALLWDYFILSPVYAFRITNIEDGLLFGMYFVVALLMGQLTTRIRAQETAERLREERATALFLLTRELTEAANLDQVVQVAVRQMEHAFKARIAVLLSNVPEPLPPPHPASAFKPGREDQRAAAWAIEHGRRAGKFSGNLPSADALYVPLAASEGIVGVIGVQFGQSWPPTIRQLNLLEAFSQQIAFALDRQRLREISEKTRLLAESERLGKTLLNSMSHEIRTPIAVLKSAASNLAQVKQTDPPETRVAISAAIQDATDRLDRLVGNVLDITRLESGHVKPRFNECDVSELVHLAISETEPQLSRHHVNVEIQPGLPIVQMDFVLMQQALSNLLSNAAFHTPPGTAVQVSARMDKDFLVLEVADCGPGIRSESLGRVFEKFYRGRNAPTGGTGLGLSLVKGFVDAQGGQVRVRNRTAGGAIFTILLPLSNNPMVSAMEVL